MTNNGFIYSIWRLVLTPLVLASIVSLCWANKARATENWSREPFYEMKTRQTPPFTLVSISSIDDHLIGDCGYIDLKGTSPTAIKGSQSADGNFWPTVTYQAGNEFRGKCKAIGKSLRKGKPRTLSIKPKDTHTILYVSLDIFRPLIAKYKFGRIVLPNGESTTFALKYLLPPKNGE
jgi:hypothetical protein